MSNFSLIIYQNDTSFLQKFFFFTPYLRNRISDQSTVNTLITLERNWNVISIAPLIRFHGNLPEILSHIIKSVTVIRYRRRFQHRWYSLRDLSFLAKHSRQRIHVIFGRINWTLSTDCVYRKFQVAKVHAQCGKCIKYRKQGTML